MTHPDINELLELLKAIKKDDVSSSQRRVLDHVNHCDECYDQFCRLALINDTMDNPEYTYTSKEILGEENEIQLVENGSIGDSPRRYVIPVGSRKNSETLVGESEKIVNGSSKPESSSLEEYSHIIPDEHERYMSSGKTYGDNKMENKQGLPKDDITDLSRYNDDGLVAKRDEKPILMYSRNGWRYIAILALVLLSVGLFIGYSVMMLQMDDTGHFPAASVDDSYIVPLQLANIGDIVLFGRYEQDNNMDNGFEDIEWIVLDKEEDGTLLLLSKYALNCKRYDENGGGVTWETCTLREWLNSNVAFYGIAFDEKEKEMILTTKLRNDDNPKYGTEGGNDTLDRVFLLSLEEAQKYFSNDEVRQCKPTPYAVAKGVDVYGDQNTCWWWLRSPGGGSESAAFVNVNGSLYFPGGWVDYGDDAVRPSLRIHP